MLTIACPTCESRLTIAPEMRGKAIRCSKCKAVFRLQPPASPPPAAPAVAPLPAAVVHPPPAAPPALPPAQAPAVKVAQPVPQTAPAEEPSNPFAFGDKPLEDGPPPAEQFAFNVPPPPPERQRSSASGSRQGARRYEAPAGEPPRRQSPSRQDAGDEAPRRRSGRNGDEDDRALRRHVSGQVQGASLLLILCASFHLVTICGVVGAAFLTEQIRQAMERDQVEMGQVPFALLGGCGFVHLVLTVLCFRSYANLQNCREAVTIYVTASFLIAYGAVHAFFVANEYLMIQTLREAKNNWWLAIACCPGVYNFSGLVLSWLSALLIFLAMANSNVREAFRRG